MTIHLIIESNALRIPSESPSPPRLFAASSDLEPDRATSPCADRGRWTLNAPLLGRVSRVSAAATAAAAVAAAAAADIFRGRFRLSTAAALLADNIRDEHLRP